MTDRCLLVTVPVSLTLHAAAVAAILYFLHGGVFVADGPGKQAEVELVMEEHQGDAAPPAAPVPPTQAALPKDQASEPAPARPPVEAEADVPRETPDPPRESQPQKATGASPPEPPPTISLHGTDSPSDAKAWGARIVPAAPDAVFHNRPPEYPAAAARARQQGAVIVVVHVSPSGHAASVDVVQSSGYALLDQAARDAVLRWRFLPAVRDGQPTASDMTMQFVFDAQ